MSIALNELRVQNSIASGEKLIVAGSTAEVQIDYDVLARAIVEQWSGSTLAGTSQSVKSAIDAAQTTSETLNTNIAALHTRISQMSGGVPPTASSTSGMNPEVSPIYVNTTDGKWYYYNGSAWTSGGEYGGAVTDSTLTQEDVPADSKAVGDALAEKADADDVDALDDRVTALESDTSGGLTADIKAALLACFAKVAWIDDDGQDYYDALDAALNPPAGLVSISAVYTQSGTVYDTVSLDSLKPDLTVTAHYDNATTQVVTNYTLSGTLTEGTSTIAVTLGGKTTTFNVTVNVFSTAPVIATEGVVWDKNHVQSNKEGFGVTKWYDYSFSQETLEGCQYWDSTNGYMSTNGWAGVAYYITDVKTLAAGYTWPSGSNYKNVWGKDSTATGMSSMTLNSEASMLFARQSTIQIDNNCLSFTIPLLDKDDCYAYWKKPLNGSILPDGVSVGDIIFAGRNTPYYGCKNISEASS